MPSADAPWKIGLTCYPGVGGSGILATALGEELARRGHDVHFISYERPVRLTDSARIHFHPVIINDYELFKYPDYTLPLSVKMAEISRVYSLDILHVHYAVPHATAAILARAMLPPAIAPRVVTTLHGTDTTLLGRDPGYGPAIRHALDQSDAVTAVSTFLAEETHCLLPTTRPPEVIHNFFVPSRPARNRDRMRAELGVQPGEILFLHASNLRPLKRIDLLLETLALLPVDLPWRLLVLAGGDWQPHAARAASLGVTGKILVLTGINDIENYLSAADLTLYTSETESFCLGILEGMFFGLPSVSTAVGGIPEVIVHGQTGLLAPPGGHRLPGDGSYHAFTRRRAPHGDGYQSARPGQRTLFRRGHCSPLRGPVPPCSEAPTHRFGTFPVTDLHLIIQRYECPLRQIRIYTRILVP